MIQYRSIFGGFMLIWCCSIGAADEVQNGKVSVELPAYAKRLMDLPPLLGGSMIQIEDLRSRRVEFQGLLELMRQYRPLMVNLSDFHEKSTLNVLNKQQAELAVVFYESLLGALMNMDKALEQLEKHWGDWSVVPGQVVSGNKEFIDYYNFSVLRSINQLALAESCQGCIDRIKTEIDDMGKEDRDFALDESIRSNAGGAAYQEFKVGLKLSINLDDLKACWKVSSAIRLPLASFVTKN